MSKIKSWFKWIKEGNLFALSWEVIGDWKSIIAMPLTCIVFLQWLAGDMLKEKFSMIENAKALVNYILGIEPFYLLGMIFLLMLATCCSVAKKRDEKIKELQERAQKEEDKKTAINDLLKLLDEFSGHTMAYNDFIKKAKEGLKANNIATPLEIDTFGMNLENRASHHHYPLELLKLLVKFLKGET